MPYTNAMLHYLIKNSITTAITVKEADCKCTVKENFPIIIINITNSQKKMTLLTLRFHNENLIQESHNTLTDRRSKTLTLRQNRQKKSIMMMNFKKHKEKTKR